MSELLLLAALIVVGHACQSLLGFGGAFIPVALGALWFPIGELKLIVIVLNVPTAAWMALRDVRAVDVKRLAWPIAPWLALGLIVGLVGVHRVDAVIAKRVLGAFVASIALVGLVHAWRLSGGDDLKGAAPSWRMRACLLLGGAMQGGYAAGIPLTALGLLSIPWDRRTRLASIGALCLVVYVSLTIIHIVDGALSLPTWRTCALLLPAVGAGVLVGELLRERIPERPFRLAVWALLVCAGLALALAARGVDSP